MGHRLCLLVPCLALFVGACTAPTQLLVTVTRDEGLTDISGVDYTVWGATADGNFPAEPTARGQTDWPAVVAIRPQDNDATRRVFLEITSRGTPRITVRRRIQNYERGQITRVTVHLTRPCLEECDITRSCEDGACVEVPVITPGNDAGMADAQVSADASRDARGLDAFSRDAAEPRDAFGDAFGPDACGVESCNGIDDDCDGVPDDGACVVGAEPCTAFTLRDHVYQFCRPMRSRELARAACSGFPDYELVRLESLDENDFVNARTTTAVWTQLNDLIAEGSFRFEDGTVPTFTRWQMGEPNNFFEQDCVVQLASGSWDDVGCAVTYAFVCERAIGP